MAEAGPERSPPPLRRQLARLLGLAGAVLMVCLLVIVVSFGRLALIRRSLVDRIDPAALAARDLRTAVIDQETGVRGYALTRDRSFLEPYVRGQDAAERSRARLQELAGDEPTISPKLAAALTEIERWHDDYARDIIAGVERGEPEVGTEAFLDASRLRFDAVRRAFDDLDSSLMTEKQSRSEALFATNGQVGVAIGVLGVAIVVVGSLLLAALRRWVTDPVENLSLEVREVAAGDLGHEVHAVGSAELVSLARDIDAMRARILDELERLRAATERLELQAENLARSNADLEQFAYVASHDLQEPLRKVAGFCQLLQRRYGGEIDERADEYIHYAVDGAQRMQQLINDLLAFSRVGRTTERFEEVDLETAARRAVDNLAAAIDSAGATVAMEGDLPTVSGDPRLLAALLQNLIGNGIKFQRPDVPPRIEVRAETDLKTDEVHVAVSDNGIGIDPQYGEQIFTLFKRLHAKTEYAGTGIGLALCKRIVEFHGGHITLGPTNGTGTTFTFTLPLHHRQEPISG